MKHRLESGLKLRIAEPSLEQFPGLYRSPTICLVAVDRSAAGGRALLLRPPGVVGRRGLRKALPTSFRFRLCWEGCLRRSWGLVWKGE